MTELFLCPICKQPLEKQDKLYRCGKNHCFDRAKSGYVNLLTDNQKNSKMPGDNKLMVNARHNFLSKGYYAPLLEHLISAVMKHLPKTPAAILDIGCGEGYYTAGLQQALTKQGDCPAIAGIDISKLALEKAAARSKIIDFAVASAFHLPVESGRFDLILNLFAPYCAEEFSRVLTPHGKMILVIPAENHLFQLKEIVYPVPYKNEPKGDELEGFQFLEKIQVKSRISLSCNEDILALFTMTPYYYKTAKEDYERLTTLQTLDTDIEFEILIYETI